MNAIADLPATERPAIDGAVYLPLGLCAPSPTNPRKKFDASQLAELTSSIKKHGLIQPILVRPWPNAKAGQPLYEIVAGERRWRASQQADTGSIMALVRQMTDFEVLELQLIENLQRRDLHPLEEAEGYARLLRKPDGLQGYASADELAEKIGKSRSYVFQRLKLLDLAKEGREAFAEDKLSFSIALLIARLHDAADQARATKTILQGWGGEPMTFRAASEYLQREFMLSLAGAPFKIADATLVPQAGACTTCPKRTGANPDLFEDVKRGDNCTDAACYHAKEEAHRARVKSAAEAKGMEVIDGAAAKKIKPQNYSGLKGFLELDKVHHQLHPDKTLRKLLGKHTLPVKLLEDPHTHLMVEVVPESDALQALKEAGTIKRASMPGSSAQERANEAKAKAETAWRSEAAREIVEAAGHERGRLASVRTELLTEVALLLWQRMENDHCKRVERLMGWAPLPGSSYEPSNRKAEEARIRALSSDQFAQFLAAAVVGRDVHVSQYNLGAKPERLLRLAELLHVDVKATQQRLRDEAATRVKAGAAKTPRANKVPAPAGEAPARAKPGAAEATPETALAAALKRANTKATKATKPAKQPAVKYLHPVTGETWSGRGLQPAWVKAWLKDGRKLAELASQPGEGKAAAPAAQLSAEAADPFRTAAAA